MLDAVPRVIREAVTAWDHRTQYPLPSVPDITRGMFTVTYDLSGQHSYLVDHNIDGRILMPVRPCNNPTLLTALLVTSQ